MKAEVRGPLYDVPYACSDLIERGFYQSHAQSPDAVFQIPQQIHELRNGQNEETYHFSTHLERTRQTIIQPISS